MVIIVILTAITIIIMFQYQGCHGQGKVREKWTFFKVRKKSGEIFDIFKVSEKSGNSIFQFIVRKVSSRFWNAFLGWNVCCIASKAISLTLYICLYMTHVVVVVSGFRCECFLPNSFFLFPQKAERGWKWRENYQRLGKKAKVNENMDCFSLLNGQWKLFKVQWKSGNF